MGTEPGPGPGRPLRPAIQRMQFMLVGLAVGAFFDAMAAAATGGC